MSDKLDKMGYTLLKYSCYYDQPFNVNNCKRCPFNEGCLEELRDVRKELAVRVFDSITEDMVDGAGDVWVLKKQIQEALRGSK